MQAAREMAGAVHELEDADLAILALMLLADIGVEVSAPMVREMAVEPRLRALALCWLVDHGLEPAATLYDPGDLEAFTDVLVISDALPSDARARLDLLWRHVAGPVSPVGWTQPEYQSRRARGDPIAVEAEAAGITVAGALPAGQV